MMMFSVSSTSFTTTTTPPIRASSIAGNNHRFFLAAVFLLGLVVNSSQGFTIPAHPFTSTTATTSSRSSTTTTLKLVPEQGSQLVAAFHASTAPPETLQEDLYLMDDDEDALRKKLHVVNSNTNTEKANINITTDTTEKPPGGVASAARAVVSRIFSIPGTIMGRHPAAAPTTTVVDGLDSSYTSSSTATAFDILWGSDNHNHNKKDDVVHYPLLGFQFVQDAPHHFRVLPTLSNPSCRIVNRNNQQQYGWFAPACPLESFDSDHYCDGYKSPSLAQQQQQETDEQSQS